MDSTTRGYGTAVLAGVVDSITLVGATLGPGVEGSVLTDLDLIPSLTEVSGLEDLDLTLSLMVDLDLEDSGSTDLDLIHSLMVDSDLGDLVSITDDSPLSLPEEVFTVETT